jgi:hypothetical protein
MKCFADSAGAAGCTDIASEAFARCAGELLSLLAQSKVTKESAFLESGCAANVEIAEDFLTRHPCLVRKRPASLPAALRV